MSKFIVDEVGPSGLACVFEDDGETGYLYLYDPNGRGVLQDLQIYNRSNELNVAEDNVEVVWSSDGSKCGVLIWNEMRGIIDLKRSGKASAKLESRDSPPITDAEWLKGVRE